MQNVARARITVFSDYVCPFCYLEEPDLAGIRAAVEVDWRAYELRPDPAPPSTRTAITSTACGTPSSNGPYHAADLPPGLDPPPPIDSS